MTGDSEFDFVLLIVVSIIAFGVGLMVWLEEHSCERRTLEKRNNLSAASARYRSGVINNVSKAIILQNLDKPALGCLQNYAA